MKPLDGRIGNHRRITVPFEICRPVLVRYSTSASNRPSPRAVDSDKSASLDDYSRLIL